MTIYSAALGLYNSRIVKLINKKGQLKSSVIIDELPTIYFRGLDNLDKYSDGQPDTCQQNIQPHAKHVRGGGGGQLR